MSAAGDKPDAWMPLYVADWDAGTRHLTCEEDGAYSRLVRYYWKNGPPPDDDAQLARIVGVGRSSWRRLRPVLATFFVVADGRWVHRRVEAELATWGEKRRRYMARAAAGGRARAARAQGPAEGLMEDGEREDSAVPQAVETASRKAAKSTSKALLKPCTSASASASASAAGDRTPLHGVLSPSGRILDAARADGAPPGCAANGLGEVGGAGEAAAATGGGRRATTAPAPRAPVLHASVPHGSAPHAPVPHAPVPHAPVPHAPVPHAPVPRGPARCGRSPPVPAWPGPPATPPRPARAWPGPPDIRALVVAARGEAYAASYLDPAGWEAGPAPERLIIPRTGAAAERLRRDLRAELQSVGVRVGPRGDASPRAGPVDLRGAG